MATVKQSRQLVPIRLYKDEYAQIKAKIVSDRVTFQKLCDILFKAYLKDNKEIKKLVEKYADDKYTKKRRYSLDETTANELLRIIETEHSPLRTVEGALRDVITEIEEEQLNDEINKKE